MAVQRCPECGGRLKSNYCDVCMRKVPYTGAKMKKYRDPWEYSSAHREEKNHKCITFDAPQTTAPKQTFTKPQTAFPKKQAARKPDPKTATVAAIILAIVSFIPAVFSIFEDVHIDNPSPEYNVEAFMPEEDLPVLQPEVVYDDGEITVQVESLGTYYDEPALSFFIENDADRDIDVMVEKVAVNGYMIDAGMSAPVDAGESCQAFMALYHYTLENAGVKEIAQISLRLRIYDRSNYTEIGYVDLWTLETDAPDAYTQTGPDYGWEMVQESGMSVYLLNGWMSGDNICELSVLIENLSEDTATIYTTAVRVNGQEVNGVLWSSLLPNTRAMNTIYMDGLRDLDITDYSEITEIDIEYVIEYSDETGLLDQLICSVLFNPNALPTSD